MTSFLSKLFGRPAPAPTKPAAAKPAVAKSAARLADERNILESRRAILANMARIDQNPSAKQKAIGLIDQDTDRAAQIVRQILLGQQQK